MNLYAVVGRIPSASYSLYWDDEQNPVQHGMTDREVFHTLASLLGKGSKIPADIHALVDDVMRALPQIEFEGPVSFEIHLSEIRRHLYYAEGNVSNRLAALVNAGAAVLGALLQLNAQEKSE